MKKSKRYRAVICYRSLPARCLERVISYHDADLAKQYLIDSYTNVVTGEKPFVEIEDLLTERELKCQKA